MKNYSDNIRRKDRQESDSTFLKDLMQNCISCTIAIERDGYPLNHVAFFVYDEENHEIVFHFSKHGFAGSEITDSKKVCVSVHKYGKLYTAPRAVDFGCEYQSVIIYGSVRILKEESARMEAMSLFFKKFFHHIPEDTYSPFTSAEAKSIHVARIRIDDWFGKEHRVPAIATSAFYPEGNSLME